MKNPANTIYLAICLSLCFFNLAAQTQAVMETGDTIYVYDNGTWSFELTEQAPVSEELAFTNVELTIDTLSQVQAYTSSANKEVKNINDQFRIKYNDKLWSRIPPATLNDEAEFAFQSKVNEIWCVVISEETPIQVDHLFRIAKKTMEETTGTEAKILKTELRQVNGENVLRGVLRAEFSGIVFVFDTYYFSNELGSVQFTTWTSEVVWQRNQDKIHDLLNGFIVAQHKI